MVDLDKIRLTPRDLDKISAAGRRRGVVSGEEPPRPLAPAGRIAVEWSPQQREAQRLVGEWRRRGSRPYFVLAGYAGTGKTTLARHLAAGVAGKVYFAAFTGKAAHVLRRTGIEASTIHRLIYLPRDKCGARLALLERELARLREDLPEEAARLRREIAAERENLRRPDFTLNEDSPLRGAALLVIDEYSMVDERMGEDLLGFGCPILALGDPGQLPPVRGTRYFGAPDFTLEEVHRQAAESPVLRLATLAREGRRLPKGEHGESRVLTWSAVSGAKLVSMMLGADQILVGLNVTRKKINAEVRRQLGRSGPLPEVGDKLVCLRNNPDEGLLNGQIWTVAGARARAFLELELVGEEGERARCLSHRGPFEGKDAPLDPISRKRANDFDFGYALTVHKAQGSQWDRVVLCDEWRGTDRQKWLYTGITRAAESVTILEA